MTAPHPIPAAALDSHLAVLGTSGYGKTNAVKGAVEQLLDRGERVVIVDPTGVWWGLRLTRDGRKPSPYPLVIFGGRHADLPLDAGSGVRIAQVLGTSTTPAILDTQAMSVAARTRFFIDFAETILRENRGPLHLILDEAHAFAPQSGGSGLIPALLHATNNLVAMGRSAGIRVVLITQRAAKLHKDALSQASTLVVLGLIDPRDKKAAKGWLDGAPDQSKASEIYASLASLPIGVGWIYAPRLSVLEKAAFPLVRTFDSGRPEANADAPALKPLDVAALREAMAQSSVSDGPSVAKAAKQPNPKNGQTCQPEELAAAEQRGYARGFVEGALEGARQGWSKAMGEAREVLGKASDKLETRRSIDEEMATTVVKLAALAHQIKRSDRPLSAPTSTGSATDVPGKPAQPAAPAPAAPTSAPKASPRLNSAGSKMLAVLDTDPPVRRSWRQVATLAGLKARGGHFNTGKKGLVDAGLVVDDGSLVAIAKPSDGAMPAARNPDALIETWCAALSGAAPKILRALYAEPWDAGVRRRPGNLRDMIAEELGMQPRGGHWNSAWKELRDNGLVSLEGNVAWLSDLFDPP